MTAQEAILRECTHQTGTSADCEVNLGNGEVLFVCCKCWNKSVYARRAERKAQLAAEPRCEVPKCNRRAAIHSCGARLCKAHFTKAENNWQRNAGFLLFAPVQFTRDDILRLAME